MLWVIVIIAADGTVSAVGTRSGRPFTSHARALRAARKWDDGRQVVVVSVDPDEEPS